MAKPLFRGDGESVDTLAVIVRRAKDMPDRNTLGLSIGIPDGDWLQTQLVSAALTL